MNASDQPAIPQARHRLEPGDRFPDFVLRDQAGEKWGFYNHARGLGTAIFFDSDQTLRAALRELAAAYEAARLDCVIVDGAAQDSAPWPTSLVDPQAAGFRHGVRDLCGRPSGPAGSQPLAILLDRNQRVLALSDEGDLARWALARWSEEAAPPSGAIGQVAPALVVPNVLPRADCRALIARWHRMGHRPGTVASLVDGEYSERVNEDTKKRLDHTLSDPAVRKPLMAMVARRLGPEVGKAFCFGSFRFDRVLIACYDAARGDFFRPHRDNRTPATAGRRFALTLNLNADEYDGGELVFPEYGDQRYKPPTGAAIVFSCSLLHEALPVTRGQRFALLSFLMDLDPPAPQR